MSFKDALYGIASGVPGLSMVTGGLQAIENRNLQKKLDKAKQDRLAKGLQMGRTQQIGGLPAIERSRLLGTSTLGDGTGGL